MRTVSNDLQSRPRMPWRGQAMFSSVPTRFLSSHSSCFSGTWIVTVLYTVQLYLFFFTLLWHHSTILCHPGNYNTWKHSHSHLFSVTVFKPSHITGCYNNHSLAYFKGHSLAKPKFSSTLYLCVLSCRQSLPITASQPLTSMFILTFNWLSLLPVSFLKNKKKERKFLLSFFLRRKRERKTKTTNKLPLRRKHTKFFQQQPSLPLNCQ